MYKLRNLRLWDIWDLIELDYRGDAYTTSSYDHNIFDDID